MSARVPRLLAAAATGYALGTIPSADVAARLASGGTIDLREQGSGNPGAANAIGVLGRKWGLAVMAADIAKGAAAAKAGGRLTGTPAGAHAAGTAAVVGHCLPVWNGFRGGKGVAAAVGQCAVTFPAGLPPQAAVAAMSAVPRLKSRTGSAAVTSSGAWVLLALLWWRKRLPNAWGPPPTAALPIAAAASSAVIVWRFRAGRSTPR